MVKRGFNIFFWNKKGFEQLPTTLLILILVILALILIFFSVSNAAERIFG